MDQNNPYQPPKSDITTPDTKLLDSWRICGVVLISLQTVLFALNVPTFLETASTGVVSTFTFLFTFLAGLLLGVGGLMLFLGLRLATVLLGFSALFSFLVVIQSISPLAITGLGIALIATLISIRSNKQ